MQLSLLSTSFASCACCLVVFCVLVSHPVPWPCVPVQDAPWPGQLIGLTGGFSWLNQYGAAMGKSFPPGNDYAVFDRITDAFNVNTEYTVPEMALALGVLAVLTG